MDLRGLLAGPETLMSVGSGMLAQPLSGLAGLLALPAGPERAANVVRNTQERLTYQPQTPQGQRMVGALGGLLAPVGEAYNAVKQATGDAGYAVGGPVGGMLGSALPDAAAMALPMAFARRTPQAFPLQNQSQAGAIVYHGSPHKFDRFDSSKIGTGEGAQAYGHGLYFADNPDVAATYAGVGKTKGGFRAEERLTNRYTRATDMGDYDTAAVLEELLINRSPNKAYSRFAVENGYSPEQVTKMRKVIDELRPQFIENGMYKVDLPDSAIANMVDYDKPLSGQPEAVKKAINGIAQQLGVPLSEFEKGPLGPTVTRAAMEDSLKAAGIPGIRYLDGGSRGLGAGTSNYVVFPGNEGLLKILGTNEPGAFK